MATLDFSFSVASYLKTCHALFEGGDETNGLSLCADGQVGKGSAIWTDAMDG